MRMGRMVSMSRPNRLEVLLVAVIVVICAFYVRWTYIPSFPDRHVAASEARFDFDVGDPGPWFSAWSLGDGQAYVLIAIDPTGEKLAEEVPEAGYRFSRAAFGWLGWALSVGQNSMIPYSLLMVGLLSVIGLLAAAVSLRPRLGTRARLILCNPAIYIGLAGDTAEPLALLLLVLALASESRIAAAALGITRPDFLVSLWGKWRLFLPGALSAIALLAYSSIAFGVLSLTSASVRIGPPLAGFASELSFGGVVLALVAIATVVLGVKEKDWSWIVSGAFVLCFAPDVLANSANAWRAAGFLPVLWAFGTNYVPERGAFSVVSTRAPA